MNIDLLFDKLLGVGLDARVAVLLIAMLPVAEARLAIPFGIGCGLTPFEALGYGFLGSSLPVPLLLVAFIPLVKRLATSRPFKRLGEAILSKVSGKADSLGGGRLKRMVGVGAFVAVPLPLTGVWTGSAVASVVDVGFVRSLLSVLCGNFIASAIVTVVSALLADYADVITLCMAGVALGAVLVMLFRAFLPRRRA